MQALTIDDIHISDLIAFAPRERRQEAMQSVEIRQLEKQVAAECLEAASRIARTVAQDRATNAIGDARLQFLETGRLAADALARNEADLGALEQRLDQGRQE